MRDEVRGELHSQLPPRRAASSTLVRNRATLEVARTLAYPPRTEMLSSLTLQNCARLLDDAAVVVNFDLVR